MSQFSDSLDQKLKEALKNKDQATISNLRLLKASLTNERIAKMHDLSEEEEMQVVRREVKKRLDSAQIYKDNGQAERAKNEEAEADFFKAYLPAEMSDEDLKALVLAAIAKSGVTDAKDFGKAMGTAKKEVGNRASGERISVMVREALNK